MAAEIWLERLKWPARDHYGGDVHLLGEDDHGVWVHLPLGQPVWRGAAIHHRSATEAVIAVSRSGGWQAWFLESGPFDLYVDIVTNVEITDDRITMVDLDFDVIRYPDGRVVIDDADEFERNRVELAYPDDVVAFARAEVSRVFAAVQRSAPPFDRVAARSWLDAARG